MRSSFKPCDVSHVSRKTLRSERTLDTRSKSSFSRIEQHPSEFVALRGVEGFDDAETTLSNATRVLGALRTTNELITLILAERPGVLTSNGAFEATARRASAMYTSALLLRAVSVI
jgi:hypothetical protein